MAQMALPTAAQKAKTVEKAQRHYDRLKKQYDEAEAVVREVKPGLDQAKQYLDYVKGMPVVDAATPVAQDEPAAPEQADFAPVQDEAFV